MWLKSISVLLQFSKLGTMTYVLLFLYFFSIKFDVIRSFININLTQSEGCLKYYQDVL